MIDRLVLLGGLGDLVRRYLAPALAELAEQGTLPAGFEVVGLGTGDLDDDAYRERLGAALEEHAADVPADARAWLVDRLHYVRGDATDPDDLRRALNGERRSVAYLALPPAVFAPAIRALGEAGIDGVVVVEKPFGHDLASARELNRVVHDCVDEESVFRIDHFLGMQTVQNLLGLRFANRVLEPLWRSEHVAAVEIVWDETLALEGRGFYDDVGAVRDMVQNHLLQMLCLVAMEPPSAIDARELRDRKVQLLRDVGRLRPEEVAEATVRGRYTAGTIDGRDVPAYADEDGVDPDRQTETFAEVTLRIDGRRWSGVPFVLRTGKALGRERKEIVVRFRDVPHGTFGAAPGHPNELRIALEPEAFSLRLNVNTPGDDVVVEPISLRRDLARATTGAYARVLRAALEGDPTLSIRDDEVEESWAIVDPILEAWADGAVPLHEYPAGSAGPAAARLSDG